MKVFKVAFVALLTATTIWAMVFSYVLQQYGMPYVLTVNLSLFLAWWVFIWSFLSNLKLSEVKKATREISKLFIKLCVSVRRLMYASVLGYFKAVNRKAKRKLAGWYMKYETSGHVDSLVKVFKWVVLPASLLYVCADLYFFRQNSLTLCFWAF